VVLKEPPNFNITDDNLIKKIASVKGVKVIIRTENNKWRLRSYNYSYLAFIERC
tara:strand:- start:441 stop:602 length:162 start_codon:yes stop_codon:yes gene_type:complete